MSNMLLLTTMADTAANGNGGGYFSALGVVYVVGFIAAATIGSIAWYNSKRPVGWEDKERPDVVPEVKQEGSPGLGTPES
jgi:putative exporter of polyketide antibiotics